MRRREAGRGEEEEDGEDTGEKRLIGALGLYRRAREKTAVAREAQAACANSSALMDDGPIVPYGRRGEQ